jgi:hypothetical protein
MTSSAPPVAAPTPPPTRLVVVAAAGALTLMLTFVGVFLAAFHDPRPNRIPVAVVATADEASDLQAKVDDLGLGTIHAIAVGSPDEAREKVLNQTVQAAVVPGAESTGVLVAQAASPMQAQALQLMLGRALGPISIQDVRPLPGGDSRGLATVFVAFGLTVAGLAFGAALALVGRRSRLPVLFGVLGGISVLGGLGVALIADLWVGALTGAFWQLAGLAALLVLAVAATMSGLGRLAGPIGLALGLLVVLLFGLSSAGGPLGYLMLPDFYRTLSQALPTGAAVTAIRHAVYFDTAHIAQPVLVLEAWALGGVLAVAAAPAVRRALARKGR